MTVLSHIFNAIVGNLANGCVSEGFQLCGYCEHPAYMGTQQPEQCYKGLVKTGATEHRYFRKEAPSAKERTFPHAEDDSVLYPVLKADFRARYWDWCC